MKRDDKKVVMSHIWRHLAKYLKFPCIEDEVDMRLSEDEAPMECEDAHQQNGLTPHHRPPSYNPEDYAHALTKYTRAPNLYANDHKEKKGRGKDRDRHTSAKDTPEMSLKQFASLPELLRRLREDLKTAYLSFVKELVRDPHDGVALLLELLKMIQLAQANLSANPTNREQQIALRRALIDEFECLSCMRCCLRCSDAAPRLANFRNGLYALSAATMSSLTRSRTLALQLLTKACENSNSGHRQVVEAFSTLRLRFAEPVRCKFLISMMLSHPHPSFLVWGLKFINGLVTSSSSLKERIYLQEEMGEAGFDIALIKKSMEQRGSATQHQKEAVLIEVQRWNEGYIDLTALEEQLTSLKSSNSALQKELSNIRQSNMKLLEENVLLKTVGSEIEDRCTALKRRLEHNGIPSAPSPAPSITDSEVSSFATTGRNTIRRNDSVSPNRNSNSLISEDGLDVDTERSMSLGWKPGDSSQMGHQHIMDGTFTKTKSPPVAKKRQIMNQVDVTIQHSHALNNHYENGYVSTDEDLQQRTYENTSNGGRLHGDNDDGMSQIDQGGILGIKVNGKKLQSTSTETVIVESEYQCQESSKRQKNISNPIQNHLYHSPIRSSRPKSRSTDKFDDSKHSSKSNSSKSNSESSDHLSTPEKSPSAKSLSSSTSSLSRSSSTASLGEAVQKDPPYENVPKKEIQQMRSERPKSRAGGGSEEGDFDYERDVVVYEAFTAGNDTIMMMDKNSTHGSKGSSKSSSSVKSVGLKEGPSVRLSVRHYENLVGLPEKRDELSDVEGKESQKNEGKKSAKEMKKKKKSEKEEKKEAKKDKLKEKKEKASKSKKESREVTDAEVEAVMNGLESVLRSAESSLSVISGGTVKENPLHNMDLNDPYEDRVSPENPIDRLEIVPSRAPRIPPRGRSSGGSSHSSSVRSPEGVIYLDSPSETSDTDIFSRSQNSPSSPKPMDTESTKSFGWIKGEAVKRRDTFRDFGGEAVPRDHASRLLKRSESMHNGSEYNSHRSYSPRRRRKMSSDQMIPLEESEVQISGRTYTKYAPQQEVENQNKINELMSAEMRRRRNRSFDSLDQWLDDDYVRQITYEKDLEASKHHRKKWRPYNEKHSKGEKENKAKSRNLKKLSQSELNAFNGFKNPTTGLRESDYGPNFMLNSPGNRLEEVLSDLAVNLKPHSKSKNGRNGRRKLIEEDPAIPTPDYSATPAGTLTNATPGRHILDMPSGLY